MSGQDTGNLSVTVKLNLPGGGVERHHIEVINYHVHGYKRVRCLTHGHGQGPAFDRGELVETAKAAARECCRIGRLPFASPSPIDPILVKQDGAWVLKEGVTF